MTFSPLAAGSSSLCLTSGKFELRFGGVEALLATEGYVSAEVTLAEIGALWRTEGGRVWGPLAQLSLGKVWRLLRAAE